MYHSDNPRMLVRQTYRRWASSLICLFLLVFIGSPRNSAAAGRDAAPQAILAAVNAARATAGLPPLAWDSRLATAATRHARDLQRCGRLSHTGCNGSDLVGRLRDAGFAYRFGAENLALCACDAAEVVRLWLDSDGHRRNLLNPVATGLGADTRTDTEDPRRVLWVLVLGKPSTE